MLIESVLSIPSYAMSCFKMPSSLCKEMEQLCAKFWCRSSHGKNGIHWVPWAALCKPKQLGGIGFRCMFDFIKALVAKQV